MTSPWDEYKKRCAPLKKKHIQDVTAVPSPRPFQPNIPPTCCPIAPPTQHSLATFDPRLYKKISSGKVRCDISVDLHGYTRSQAYDKIQHCIIQAFQQQKRLVRLITGKGTDGKGVLKTLVPQWLQTPPLSSYVISVRTATKHTGGEGALYIHIKKQKV